MHRAPESPTFSRADANLLGWSDAALARAVRSGRLVRVRRGHFATCTPTPELAAIAAAHACADSVVSHRSALLLHGLPIVGPIPPVPELTVRPGGRVDVAGAHMYRATLPPEQIVVVGDVPVASIARTLIDVGRHRPTSTAVAAMDQALHERRTTVDELHEVLRSCWNWPRVRRAARALRLADGRAESPLESVSRLVIGWLRLPAPAPQTVILDRFGYPAGRLDFYWDECGVAGEADGRSKYDDRDVLTGEKERQEKLEDDGLVFVRWRWHQVVHEPQRLRSRLISGFERGARRDRSGFTRLWSVQPPQTDDRTVKRDPQRPPDLQRRT